MVPGIRGSGPNFRYYYGWFDSTVVEFLYRYAVEFPGWKAGNRRTPAAAAPLQDAVTMAFAKELVLRLTSCNLPSKAAAATTVSFETLSAAQRGSSIYSVLE